ncbi:MAG TPA: phosphomannomutase/phosphoglucomutase, partial [bacterium]|nr:phosphomannomutase/phosphoglucomutase [bacterium]
MKNIDQSIFRGYDIRGIYPKEINEKSAFLIGQAFVEFLKKTSKKKALNIIVGRDGRLSSPILSKKLIQGIIERGANVIDIGLSTSPMLYWATAFYKLDGGIETSASHNPSQYNGFKLVREKSIPIGDQTGLRKIKELTQIKLSKSSKKGKIKKKEILKDYL